MTTDLRLATTALASSATTSRGHRADPVKIDVPDPTPDLVPEGTDRNVGTRAKVKVLDGKTVRLGRIATTALAGKTAHLGRIATTVLAGKMARLGRIATTVLDGKTARLGLIATTARVRMARQPVPDRAESDVETALHRTVRLVRQAPGCIERAVLGRPVIEALDPPGLVRMDPDETARKWVRNRGRVG